MPEILGSQMSLGGADTVRGHVQPERLGLAPDEAWAMPPQHYQLHSMAAYARAALAALVHRRIQKIHLLTRFPVDQTGEQITSPRGASHEADIRIPKGSDGCRMNAPSRCTTLEAGGPTDPNGCTIRLGRTTRQPRAGARLSRPAGRALDADPAAFRLGPGAAGIAPMWALAGRHAKAPGAPFRPDGAAKRAEAAAWRGDAERIAGDSFAALDTVRRVAALWVAVVERLRGAMAVSGQTVCLCVCGERGATMPPA